MFSEEAVVGFSRAALSIGENNPAGIDVEIYLGAAAGTPATDVTLEVSTQGHANPAVLGEDFTISSMNVNVAVGIASVKIVPVDDDVFTGNRTFTLKIASNSQNYPLTAQSQVLVTILDNEHPLKLVIGTYHVVGTDAWGDPVDATVVTSPVDGDLTKVSFPLVQLSGYDAPATNKVMVNVDLAAGTFRIQVGQTYPTWGYGPCKLSGYDGATGSALEDGSFIRGLIDEDGNITFLDYMGVLITSGVNAGLSFNIWSPDVVWTKVGNKALIFNPENNPGTDMPLRTFSK